MPVSEPSLAVRVLAAPAVVGLTALKVARPLTAETVNVLPVKAVVLLLIVTLLVSLVTLVSWVVAWRRKLRADGLLARTSRWQARREARAQQRRQHEGEGPARRPDPAQVLSELRALLSPLLAEPANGQAAGGQAAGGRPAAPAPHGYGIPTQRHEPGEFGEPDGDRPVPNARSGGLTPMESMLAGPELLMVSGGEEEAW